MMNLSVVPAGLDAFSTVNTEAANLITESASADSGAMLGAVAAALGPIGATYLAAYGPAQMNNLSGTLMVAGVHAAIGEATSVSKAAYIVADGA